MVGRRGSTDGQGGARGASAWRGRGGPTGGRESHGARAITEADGQRAGLFRPGDGIVPGLRALREADMASRFGEVTVVYVDARAPDLSNSPRSSATRPPSKSSRIPVPAAQPGPHGHRGPSRLLGGRRTPHNQLLAARDTFGIGRPVRPGSGGGATRERCPMPGTRAGPPSPS